MYEEFRTGTLDELVQVYAGEPPRGEITVLLEGAERGAEQPGRGASTWWPRRPVCWPKGRPGRMQCGFLVERHGCATERGLPDRDGAAVSRLRAVSLGLVLPLLLAGGPRPKPRWWSAACTTMAAVTGTPTRPACPTCSRRSAAGPPSGGAARSGGHALGRRTVERVLSPHDGPRQRALQRRRPGHAAALAPAGGIPPRRRQLRHGPVDPPRAGPALSRSSAGRGAARPPDLPPGVRLSPAACPRSTSTTGSRPRDSASFSTAGWRCTTPTSPTSAMAGRIPTSITIHPRSTRRHSAWE